MAFGWPDDSEMGGILLVRVTNKRLEEKSDELSQVVQQRSSYVSAELVQAFDVEVANREGR